MAKFETRSAALSKIGSNANLEGFEDLAYVKPMRLIWFDSQFGALFDCVVVYVDQKKQPSRAEYHERSLIFHPG